MIYLYFLLLAILSIFSYSHVDPNITLINHPLWEGFRNSMVYLGYYQRGISSSIYIIIVCLLFYFHYFFIKRHKKVNLFILFTGAGDSLENPLCFPCNNRSKQKSPRTAILDFPKSLTTLAKVILQFLLYPKHPDKVFLLLLCPNKLETTYKILRP